MSLVNDVGQYLRDQGTVPAAWGLKTGFLPDDPDKCVVLYQTAGYPSNPKVGMDYPGIAVHVRAEAWQDADAEAQIDAVHDALVGVGPTTMGSTACREILDEQAAFLLEHDERFRPRFVQHFTLWRARD